MLWYTYCILFFLEERSQQIIIEDEWHLLHTIEEVPNLLWEYKTNNITRKTTRCNNSSGYCSNLAHTNKEISSQKYFSTPPPKKFYISPKNKLCYQKIFYTYLKNKFFNPKHFFFLKKNILILTPKKLFFSNDKISYTYSKKKNCHYNKISNPRTFSIERNFILGKITPVRKILSC